MDSAKDIILKPINSAIANALVRRVHYSGKVVNNSQMHIGAFLHGKLEGAMSFGPSLDKRKLQGLVEGTGWNEFIELNRMAFTDVLPRNSESRAIAVAMRLLRKHAPHLKWVVTFADGAQCGDGTIYRAAGFVLTGIKVNTDVRRMPDGAIVHKMTFLNGAKGGGRTKRRYGFHEGEGDSRFVRRIGADAIPGFQLRYVYFLAPSCRERLTVPILPFSEIERRGAGMHRGQPRAESIEVDAPAFHVGEDGSLPISALQEAAAS